MEIKYSSTNDRKQLHKLTHTLLQTRKGVELTGRTASRFFGEEMGIRLDYHEWSNTLDYMHTIGEATVTGFDNDNMTRYIIN